MKQNSFFSGYWFIRESGENKYLIKACPQTKLKQTVWLLGESIYLTSDLILPELNMISKSHFFPTNTWSSRYKCWDCKHETSLNHIAWGKHGRQIAVISETRRYEIASSVVTYGDIISTKTFWCNTEHYWKKNHSIFLPFLSSVSVNSIRNSATISIIFAII